MTLLFVFFIFATMMLNIFALYCLDQTMEFAIVTFMEDDSVADVPTCWLMYDSQQSPVCCWPLASKARKLDKMAKDRMDPAPDWTSHSVRVLHEYGMFVQNTC